MNLTLAKAFRNRERGTFVETSFMPLVGVHKSRFGGHVVVTCYPRIRFMWDGCFEVVDRSSNVGLPAACIAASATETQNSGRQFHRGNGSAHVHFLVPNGTPELLGLMFPVSSCS